jgi:hypothetical protein
LTTGRASGLGVPGRSGDHAVEHRDGLSDVGVEEVESAGVDERAAVVVADAFGDQLGLHARPSHERDCRVAEPVEAEVGNDDRAAAVALLFVREPGGEERREPDRLETGVALDAALLRREDDARSRWSHEELLAE